MLFRRMRRSIRPALGLGFALLLSGCAVVGPDYVPPKLSDAGIPGQWTSGAEAAAHDPNATTKPVNQVPATQWWAELDDALLDQMVSEGFRTSPTLEVAVSRVRQARAVYARTGAAELPSIDSEATSERAVSDSSGSP